MLNRYLRYLKGVMSLDNCLIFESMVAIFGLLVLFFAASIVWIEFLYAGMNVNKLLGVVLYPLPAYAPHLIFAFFRIREGKYE